MRSRPGRFVPLVVLAGVIAWEALVIHEEVSTGKGLTASSDALQRQAMTHFQREGALVAGNGDDALALAGGVTTATGGQFATGAFFALPNLVLHPDKAVESVVSLPSRIDRGFTGMMSGTAEQRLAAGGEFAGAVGETLSLAIGAGEGLEAIRSANAAGFKAAGIQEELATYAVERAARGGSTTAIATECAGGSCLRPGACFVAGTLVLTAEGLRPIEEVAVGDTVLSGNDRTREFGWKRVLRTFVTRGRQVLELSLMRGEGSLERLVVTPNHPFFVEGRGWVEAGRLEVGMMVPTASGGWLRVEGAVWVQEGATTYNFEVEDWHTYFVGEAAAWVHNAGDCPRFLIEDDVARALDELPDAVPSSSEEAAAWDQAMLDARADRLLAPRPPAPSAQNPRFRPGPFARESIPASSTGKATPAEQARLNELFAKHGCHSCGTKNPGTRSGNAVGDHQPPTALNWDGAAQDLYPQCLNCSNAQGLAVKEYLLSIWSTKEPK